MNGKEMLEGYDLAIILCGIAAGTIARFVTIRIDARQVPSYPNAYLIHLVTGFIASALGSVAIPALIAKDFTAFTFLALAVQHFREVRKQEQESLMTLENSEMAERGDGYIDGRNYISLLTALGTVGVLTAVGLKQLTANLLIAAASGAILIFLLVRFTKGKRIGDLCDLSIGKIEVADGSLYVDGIYVTNQLGTEKSQKLFREEGVSVVVKPRLEKHRLIVEQAGQRKAMLFDAARSFGVKQYKFTEREMADGRVVIAFVPILPDPKGIMDAIRATPVLESGRKRRRGGEKGV
jgi:hypothetical protein